MTTYISETFGDTEVLFAVKSASITGQLTQKSRGRQSKGLKANTTSSQEKVVNKLKSVRHQISEVVQGFGQDIESIRNNMGATTVELELSLSLSIEGKLIVGAKAEGTLGLKIVWEKKQ